LTTTYVLIDFESVQPESLLAIEQGPFEVVLFVGAHQSKLSVGLAMALQRLGERARYVRISGSGKNALDFHVAFYMGEIAATDATAQFHIVSRDSGFDPLVHHLRSRGVGCTRSPRIEDLVEAPVEGPPADERAAIYLEAVRSGRVAESRTIPALVKSVLQVFGKKLSEAEITGVIDALEESRAITVSAGRVTFAAAEPPAPANAPAAPGRRPGRSARR
jgi:hypothetical protein